MNRHEAREKAIQALYQIDLTKVTADEAMYYVCEEGGVESTPFLKTLVTGVESHKEEIDTIIETNTENWTIKRFGKVDLAIIRLATFEMKWMDEIPENVTMNEAIELAKTFSDDKSKRFVNGVLSNIKNSLLQ